MAKTTASITANGKQIYLNNKELLIAIAESKELGKMSDKLAKMLLLLCTRFATKGRWVNYTYNSDMIAYALMMLCRTWTAFNPEKSNNPFSFYTQCVLNSFYQFDNQERKQRNIRDSLLVNQGLNPSYNFQDEYSTDQHFVDDEQDFYYHKETAQALQHQFAAEDVFIDQEEIVDDIADEEIDADMNVELEDIDSLLT